MVRAGSGTGMAEIPDTTARTTAKRAELFILALVWINYSNLDIGKRLDNGVFRLWTRIGRSDKIH